MTMTPNADQANAIAAIKEWYADRSFGMDPFVLGGLAGTGKTALLPMLARSWEFGEAPRTRYVCPTWKAAHVLTRKLKDEGIYESATSIHNLIYNPRGILHEEECGIWESPADGCTMSCKKLAWEFDPKEKPQLLVVDEASMVGDRLREDIARLGVPTLYVGDHGQLKPVQGTSIFATHTPDALLEDIQRQALDSPIIPLSRIVRDGDRSWLKQAELMGFRVLEAGPSSSERYDPAAANPPHSDPQTVFIAGTNAGVDRLNSLTRRVLGRKGKMVPDDLVMAQNNNHRLNIYNGQQGVIHEAKENRFGRLEVELTMEHGARYSGPVLIKGIDEIPVGKQIDIPVLRHSYAVTCHKAQGSEFENVVVYLTGSRPERSQEWLYTAVTRAKTNLTFVRATR